MATTQKVLSISNSESPRRLAALCALFFAPLAALAGFSVIALDLSGELMAPREIVKRQSSSPAIYYPLYQPKSPYPSYKLAAIVARRPEVLVLGDSRGFSIRSEFATNPEKFYNGTLIGAGQIGVIRGLLEHLPPDQLPRQAILVIDPWWFRQGVSIDPEDNYFEPASRIEVVNFAWRNGMYLGLRDRLRPQPAEYIGENAYLQHRGLRPDGSFRSVLPWLGNPAELPQAVKYEIDKVDAWSAAGHTGMSQESVREMERLLAFCDTHRIRTIGYLSTLHPALYEAARQDPRLNFYWELEQVLIPVFQRHAARFFDLQNASNTGCTKSEYLDLLHESEVCTVRVLKAMAKRDSSINEIFRVAEFDHWLNERRSNWELAF
jgi:hypothetical protein